MHCCYMLFVSVCYGNEETVKQHLLVLTAAAIKTVVCMSRTEELLNNIKQYF